MSEVNNTVTIEALERQIEDLKKHVERREMAIRLASNPDFKKLILEGFCQVEAAAYVHTSCDPNIGDRERADALAIAQASGHLKRWVTIMMQMGYQAQLTIRDCEEQIDEMRAEGSE